MNQRCKKKRKRIGAQNYSQGLRTDLRGKKRWRRNIDGLSSSCFWCSAIKKKKTQKNKAGSVHWCEALRRRNGKNVCKLLLHVQTTVCEDRWPHCASATFTTGWDRWENRWIWHGVQGSPRIFHRNIKSIHILGLCREFPFYRRWCLFKQRSRKRARPIGSAGRGRQMMMNTKEISSPLTANKSRHFIIFHIY